MGRCIRVWTIIAALLLFGGFVSAELSQLVYQRMQQDTEEHYLIEVVYFRSPFRLFTRDRPVTQLPHGSRKC